MNIPSRNKKTSEFVLFSFVAKNLMQLLVLISFVFTPNQFSHAGVLGDMQTFVPNTDGLDFITVHSSRPMYEDHLVLSQYLNFAKDHLLVYKDVETQESMNYSNELAEYDFSIGYGFTKHFSAYLQAPFLWYFNSETKEGIKINVDKGVHSLRPGIKYSFSDDLDSTLAVLASVDIPSLVDSPYTGVSPKPIYNFDLAYGWKNGKAANGLNLGYRNRTPSERPTNQRMFPLDDQLTASYGYSNEFSETSRWVFETFFSYPLQKEPYKKAEDASSLDILLGLKHRWWKNTNFDWGATIEPGVKSLAPTWRVFAGIVWYWKPFGTESSAANKPQKTQSPLNQINKKPITEEGFRVTPADSTITVGDQVSYEFIGGKGPYSCEILSGKGEFIGKYCDFLAPEEPGVSEIEFKDAQGLTTTAVITYKLPSEFAGDLDVRPKQADIFEGQSIQIKGVGGKAPYRYGIVDGGGRINQNGLFVAPLNSDQVTIEVVDDVGRRAISKITVKEIPKADKIIRLSNLKFVFGKDELTKESKKEIEKILNTLFDLNLKTIIIEGHTDSIGSAEFNQVLSEKRARAVKAIFLENLDIRTNQVTAIGIGEARPIASNKTEQGRAQNRRVDLKVYIKK